MLVIGQVQGNWLGYIFQVLRDKALGQTYLGRDALLSPGWSIKESWGYAQDSNLATPFFTSFLFFWLVGFGLAFLPQWRDKIQESIVD